MMKLRNCFMAVSLLLFAAPLTAVAQDMPAGAWAGTWVANPAKSKFPGPPPTVDQVIIQPDGSVAVHVVSADGKTSDWSYKPQAGKGRAHPGERPHYRRSRQSERLSEQPHLEP